MPGDRLLIGLAGRAGSGKTTVADYLADHYGFWTGSFARPIRAMLSAGLGLDERSFVCAMKEKPIGWLDRSPRYLMQTLGTEWGRGLVRQDLWLLLAQRSLDDAFRWHTEHQPRMPFEAVFSDVRFENEADWLRTQGGIVAHVARGGDRISSHSSEAGIDLIDGDWRIDNDRCLSDLFGLVDHMVASLRTLNDYDAAATSDG